MVKPVDMIYQYPGCDPQRGLTPLGTTKRQKHKARSRNLKNMGFSLSLAMPYVFYALHAESARNCLMSNYFHEKVSCLELCVKLGEEAVNGIRMFE